MKIIINASTVAVGGGLSDTQNLLVSLLKAKHTHIFKLICPSNCGYEVFQNDGIKVVFVPKILLHKTFRFFLDYIWIPQRLKRINPDWVLTATNLPAIYKGNQAIIFNNPFVTVPKLTRYHLSLKDILVHKVRNFLFNKRMKFVKLCFVQTFLQKKLLKNKYQQTIHFYQLPNASVVLQQSTKCSFSGIQKHSNKFVILLFTRYYPHKNLEIILEVAKKVKRNKDPFVFIFTINSSQGKKAKKFLNQIQKQNLTDQILNIGSVKHSCIRALYNQVDALLLPTLLESFSSTYIDAMTFGKSILTSDKDFAHEICKNAAWYFNPESSHDIYNTIQACFNNHQERKNKISAGNQIARNHPTWQDNAHFILSKLKEKNNGDSEYYNASL